MGFYEEISKFYDYIFPTGEDQLRFIEEAAGPAKCKILDIACGSGGYTAALAKKDYDVTAVDLDSAMVDMARKKLDDLSIKANVLKADMKELSKVIDDKYRLVFCIGNSIVHLGSKNDILEALKQMYSLLEENGVLVIQIINFDRIIKYGINELPTITNREAGIEFIRKYVHNREKGVINFNTVLKVNNETKEQIFENTVELLPILCSEMQALIQKAGFKEIQLFGDFKKEQYNDTSFMLVLKAFK